MKEEKYYEEIEHLIKRNEINKRVRKLEEKRTLVTTYWNVGRLIVEAQGGSNRAKYGNELIKNGPKNLLNFMVKAMITVIYLDLENFIYVFQYLGQCPKYLGQLFIPYFQLKMRISATIILIDVLKMIYQLEIFVEK